MHRLWCGPLGSGKTTRLKQVYEQLVGSGVPTGKILVLVLNAPSVSEWRNTLRLTHSGNLNIYTYFGFVQREISRCWRQIDQDLPGGSKTLEPTFMTTETAQYLMGKIVEQYRGLQYFSQVRATGQQIAIQLIDNLNQAALNGLCLEDAGQRLVTAYSEDPEKINAFSQGKELMQQFRQNCLDARCIDYSMTVELFTTQLLASPTYLAELDTTWDYLLVDNLEETVPVCQNLIAKLLGCTKASYLAFDPNGGHGVFFGANPLSAREHIFPLCQVEELTHSYTSPPELVNLGNKLSQQITSGEVLGSLNLSGRIFTQLRGEMIQQTSKQIVSLIEQGIEPDEIAVIAPSIDKVLEFTITRALHNQGVNMANLHRGKRLLDQPFAQALLSLALLVYPEWQLEVNFSGLVQTLSILLKLDPVRSALLVEEIFRNKLKLPDPDSRGLRNRLGFENTERYEHFAQWVAERKQDRPGLEILFQQLFGELLAPLMPGEEDLLACRQVIDSVSKFNRVMGQMHPDENEQLGKQFLDMVLRGTLAAETLYRPPENTGKVVLATPFVFLFSPYVKPVKYQIWLDIAGEEWFRGYTKELTNPFILSPNWQAAMCWNDQLDQELRMHRLARIIQSLLGKCTQGLCIASSYLNSKGREQDGKLAEVLQE